MKTFPILMLSTTLFFTACGDNHSSKESSVSIKDTTSQETIANSEPPKAGTVTDVIAGYLNVKNALVNDNGSEAASAAKQMGEALAKVEESTLTPEQKKTYDDVKDDIQEHAEHMAANASNIAHQREHFDLLSQDVIDLVKATGSSQTLYRDYCPMYNNNKGASWLSETRGIKNPYLGKKMPTCGEVKEEIKARG